MLKELTGLLFYCPMEKESDDCPFELIRKIEVIKRIEFIDKIIEDEQRIILEHHKKCIKNREKQLNNKNINVNLKQ